MATLLIRELSCGYSLPIHQCASLKGYKWWSLSSFKEASLIWAFCGFVREIECPELFLGFPQLLRGRGKGDVRAPVWSIIPDEIICSQGTAFWLMAHTFSASLWADPVASKGSSDWAGKVIRGHTWGCSCPHLLVKVELYCVCFNAASSFFPWVFTFPASAVQANIAASIRPFKSMLDKAQPLLQKGAWMARWGSMSCRC